MKITKIEVQKKNKNRVNIYIDNSFFCGLSVETILRFRIKENQEISLEKLEYLKNQTEREIALEKSVKHISKSQKTEKELRQYLLKYGYDEDVIESTIEKLKNYGFVNDFEYAKAYVKFKSKSSGSKKIKYELSLKGVEKDIVEKCLNEFSCEQSSIIDVAKKYLKGKTLDKKTKEKTYRFLMGKGYNASDISSNLNKIFSEGQDESWD